MTTKIRTIAEVSLELCGALTGSYTVHFLAGTGILTWVRGTWICHCGNKISNKNIYNKHL